MLETLITSKTRIRILVKFFINAANNGYLRGLAEELNESTNAIRKELNNLFEAGYLEKEAIQNRVTYKANTKHPLFTTLQKIVFQHIGLDAIVAMILERMGDVKKIVVIGDYASGYDSGTIEVVVVGNELNFEYIDQLSFKIEKEIKRKVHFLITQENVSKGLVIYDCQMTENVPQN
ncbi:ArsR family transcriptional regulator [Flavobacterium sp. GT3R68]|uniref:ArsR family transcriptional regulator n=1 Tax=Flavobacterium sp. GT3R68 TaxID=2594437 RepID=UPI000F8678E0|nr:ArsR family transcriptional regulator [Flavobacterium sp. GT3R68]RTY92308.1 ArsR family transcriptional regulator [Flavobacterium sp. GSN2]TRW92662.1 ArsR family transcriptional regulator [Flavobacterium sp. GT3R68]